MHEADATPLADLIRAHTPYDGLFELRLPGTYAIKVSRPNTTPTHGLQRLSACIVARGAKSVMIGDDTFEYKGGQVAVYSVDLPIASQITQATPNEPYLTLRIDLDPARITELAARVFPHGAPQPKETRALYIGDADAHILDAGRRLLELMSCPVDAELIAPLVIDEIILRLLRSPMGSRIAQLGQTDSSLHRVSKAVAWLRENYDQPADVDELARLVNMSVSTFHRQFKAVTSMSPLQLQKALRLQEARRLMLTSMLDAGAAARRVGYVSASQFTREYGRFFGTPPTKDIQRLREQGPVTAETTAA
ncbi:MAG: AraC family transcriptional regulator [Acidobacteria bacterium]|nr:AraC family transcriptional regulator [Acidobacteriota bacterium]